MRWHTWPHGDATRVENSEGQITPRKNCLRLGGVYQHSGVTVGSVISLSGDWEGHPTTEDKLLLWIGQRCGKRGTGHSGQEKRKDHSRGHMKQRGRLPRPQGAPSDWRISYPVLNGGRGKGGNDRKLESSQKPDDRGSGVACHTEGFELRQETVRVH